MAPLTAIDSGSPRPSTSRLRLRPFFSPVGRVPTNAFGCKRRFAHGSVGCLPLPGDALHSVILGQASLPQFLEKTSPVPVLKVLMHRARRTELARQCFPLNAGPQNVNNRREDLPRRHWLASRPSLALVLSPWFPPPCWNQRLNLAPQTIRNCPRLDLGHIESIIAVFQSLQTRDSTSRTKLITIYG